MMYYCNMILYIYNIFIVIPYRIFIVIAYSYQNKKCKFYDILITLIFYDFYDRN